MPGAHITSTQRRYHCTPLKFRTIRTAPLKSNCGTGIILTNTNPDHGSRSSAVGRAKGQDQGLGKNFVAPDFMRKPERWHVTSTRAQRGLYIFGSAGVIGRCRSLWSISLELQRKRHRIFGKDFKPAIRDREDASKFKLFDYIAITAFHARRRYSESVLHAVADCNSRIQYCVCHDIVSTKCVEIISLKNLALPLLRGH